MDIYEQITKMADEIAPELVAQRRDFHKFAEKGWFEMRTSSIIARKLTEMGYEVLVGDQVCKKDARMGVPSDEELEEQYERAVAQGADPEFVKYTKGGMTGVIGILRCGEGPTVAMRFDIDALGVFEEKDKSHRPACEGFGSVNEGFMHACGHDGHATIGLGVAKVLMSIKDSLHGTMKLIFQPAEEHMGAGELVDCNFTQVAKPDAFIGLHVSPEIDAGSIGLKKGPANASNDFFNIKIKGKGGHGAHPENCIDPVVISGYVITQLQTVISRENYPVYPGVLTIGSIHGGTVNNIIPDYVEMHGTLRSLDPDCRKKMMAAIDRVVKGCAKSMRGTAEIEWEIGVPPLVNDDSIIEAVAEAAAKTIGADHVSYVKNPSMGSEDFSVLFPKFGPGAQFRLGSGNNEDPNSRHGLHNSKNVFDEKCIRTGASVIIQYARDFLR